MADGRPESGPPNVVETHNLRRTFVVGSEEVHAVDGVDLSAPSGSLVVLKGRSGSGKTTLLNLIGGLDRPSEGEVLVEGRGLSGLSDVEMTEIRRRLIGFVFQSFALLPTFSAYENIELPLRIAGVDPAIRSRRVRRCLDLVGLAGRDEHRPWELSGGQQQRVAIARSLVAQPRIILADEPTGELDSVSGQDIMKLFQQIVIEDGVTVIMASHDPNVDEFASIIYQLRDGRVADVIRQTSPV